MAGKSATVLARIEPEIKDQAERILSQLGIPASAAINMLYRQIIRTRSLPFQLALEPVARDEMDDTTFNAMLQRSIDAADAGQVFSLEETIV